LAAHPELTVTTKCGLYPPGGSEQPTASIWARKAAGKFWPELSRPIVDWTIGRAKASLEGSLRRLRRERVDLFLLHEPCAPLIAADEWQKWMETEPRIRAFGVAGAISNVVSFLSAGSALSNVIQTGDSLENHEADSVLQAGRPLQLTFGYASAGLKAGKADVSNMLAAALVRNSTGAIIVSTRDHSRLAQYARLTKRLE
jgi:aryl-alcohol dehydrogenase-like predicted oxidoreductase